MSFLVGLLWTLWTGPGSNEGEEFSRRHDVWEDDQYLLHRVCFGGNYCLRGLWGPHYSKSSVTTPWWWMLNFYWNSSRQSKFWLVQCSLVIWAQTSLATSTVWYFVTNIVYLTKKNQKLFYSWKVNLTFLLKIVYLHPFFICRNIMKNQKQIRSCSVGHFTLFLPIGYLKVIQSTWGLCLNSACQDYKSAFKWERKVNFVAVVGKPGGLL